jgi:hypothetical protein
MRNAIVIFTGLLIVVSSLSAYAGNANKLYKGHEFGMSKAEIMKTPNVYDCAEIVEKDALCLDEQEFVGEDVGILFRFINDKLITVLLLFESTFENHTNFIGALSSKFQLSTIETLDKKIDFIVQMKKFKYAQFLKNVTDFEQQAILSGNVKYTFLENDSFKRLVKSSANAVEMIMKAGDNIRAVEYSIISLDDGTVTGAIQFTAPKKTLQIVQEKSKQKYDDF